MKVWRAPSLGMNAGNRSLCALALSLLLIAAGCGGGEPAAPPDETVVEEGVVEEVAPEAAPEAAPAPEGAIQEESLPPDAATAPNTASADIEARSGSSASGKAVFTETSGGLRIVVDVSGASPGEHGLHIHEVGDCSAEDASSAGGHFNPEGVDHGAPDARVHHAGDLGNIMIGAEGSGRLELTMPGLTLRDGPNAVVGRAVVLHGGRDDMVSQPSGNAGARIGCGVIK